MKNKIENTYLSGTRWTQKDIDFLTKYYEQLTQQQLAERLGRSRSSIKKKVRKLDLVIRPDVMILKKQVAIKKCHANTANTKFYSAEEMAYLEKNYAETPTAELAKKLNRPILSIIKKAYEMDWKKSKKYLRASTRLAVMVRHNRNKIL